MNSQFLLEGPKIAMSASMIRVSAINMLYLDMSMASKNLFCKMTTLNMEHFY